MKKALVFVLFLLPLMVQSAELPRFCFGQYLGEMDGFDFVHNDKKLRASSQEIKLTLTEDVVYYSSGGFAIEGVYKFVADGDKKYVINAEMTNDLSVNFVLKMIYDKKNKSLQLIGVNGIPDLELKKKTT